MFGQLFLDELSDVIRIFSALGEVLLHVVDCEVRFSTKVFEQGSEFTTRIFFRRFSCFPFRFSPALASSWPGANS